jgi:hypothetical protein
MSRPKKPAVAPTGTSEPFFARYLEGQERGADSSAKVGERKSLAYKKAAKKAIKPPPLMTLKFPSDSDELHYKPYYQSKADVPKQPGGGAVTLKFPSDSDEDIYHAEYTSTADVPKGKAIKKGASIKFKKAK